MTMTTQKISAHDFDNTKTLTHDYDNTRNINS